MSNLLHRLEAEKAKLTQSRSRAEERKVEFQRRLDGLRADLAAAEAALRKSKRAALIGGPARIGDEEESALVRRLTALPVEIAALEDVIAETDKRVAAIEEDIRRQDVALGHAELDGLEATILGNRLERLEHIAALEALSERNLELFDRWDAEVRRLKGLGDPVIRPWWPNDHPDPYHHTSTGAERSREEEIALVRGRIAALEVADVD